MPIPSPIQGEDHDHFISRCHAQLADEYNDPDQRNAVCETAWNERNKKSMTHYHTLEDGRKTGGAEYSENARSHFHYLNGEKTSESNNEPNHTHMIENQATGTAIYDEEGKNMSDVMQFKSLAIKDNLEFKELPNASGVPVGIVEGYIATWDIDRGDMYGVRDQFVKGAFRESIADHLKRGRNVRLKDHHGRTVGKFLIDTVKEDDRGLWGRGEINLEVQQGRELMALIKNGDLSDFSIGFSVAKGGAQIDGDLRTITKANIWEGSVVDEPMNPYANITDFKSVVPYQDLPLADRDREWDSTAAVKRVREFTDSEDEPGAKYRQAFLWFDRENANTFAAYKLPIADVINGRLTAVPRAIFAAAAALRGARGGVSIPDSDKPGVIRNLERYYAKMDMESPFKEADKQFFVMDDVKEMGPGDIEQALRGGAQFSKSAAKFLVSRLKSVDIAPESGDNLKSLLDEIKSIKV
jgi:HK97 family phage prohead protease